MRAADLQVKVDRGPIIASLNFRIRCSEDKATVPPILLGMKKEHGKKKASVEAKLEGKCSQNR